MDAEVVIIKSATVTLQFNKVYEAKALHEELTTWTPHGGWSDLAQDFFTALAEAYQE